MFESVLIANRGEIARRVIRTLRRLGIRSVAVYSDADRDAPFVREADDAVRIGPAAAADSYLSIERILDAARLAGAQAVHPGYGFLSERADFARACEAERLVFVGPSPAAMAAMGDKVRAKAAAAAAGVPVVPSYTPEEAAATADYPLLVKAAAGGGGRGMRVVTAPGELQDALAAAGREALTGFGDDRVFIERFLPRARHIEVQVVGDRHGTVLHLGERECSLQRRHQKVLEEAPSPVVEADLRERLGAEAVALATGAGYVGAGTVEFIADATVPETHFFLEMNARLQVEHPVTELVTGLDLVELQLRVAAGEPLPLRQEDVRLDGHAIEVRVNAEDPARGFLPSSGTVVAYRRPPGVRVDDAVEVGSVVGTDYDSLLGKVIVHGPHRADACARLRRSLARMAVLGVTTNVAFLGRLLEQEPVLAGELDTQLLERLDLASGGGSPTAVAAAGALVAAALRGDGAGDDPFDRVDGWRVGGRRAWSWTRFAVDGGNEVEARVRTDGTALRCEIGDEVVEADVRRIGDDAFAITAGGERREWVYALDSDALWLAHAGEAHRLRRAGAEAAGAAAGDGAVRAPMPGAVLMVAVAAGDTVETGDTLLVIESMKMEMTIAAPLAGVVAEVGVAAGDRVALDQALARVEAA